MTVPMVSLKPPRLSSLEGFVWALVILGAARIGRKQAEDTFLDYDAIRVSTACNTVKVCQRWHVISSFFSSGDPLHAP